MLDPFFRANLWTYLLLQRAQESEDVADKCSNTKEPCFQMSISGRTKLFEVTGVEGESWHYSVGGLSCYSGGDFESCLSADVSTAVAVAAAFSAIWWIRPCVHCDDWSNASQALLAKYISNKCKPSVLETDTDFPPTGRCAQLEDPDDLLVLGRHR